VYVVPEHLGDVVAIPVGKQPSHLHVSDSSTGAAAATALSALAPSQMAPDASGGFYALADNAADTEQFVVHVRGSTATVLAKLTTASHGCRTGKQYPALANSCTTQSYLARSGSRVLLLADRSAQPEDDPQPALALKAAAS
jgi:hypothetical protein